MGEVSQIKWVSVKELSHLFPSFSEASLRYWIFHGKENGLNECLRRIGKKILINLEQFETWIDNH